MSVAMLVQHADRAEQMALIKEDRAWRYSDSFEQGKWRRVRKAIERLRRDRTLLLSKAERSSKRDVSW